MADTLKFLYDNPDKAYSIGEIPALKDNTPVDRQVIDELRGRRLIFAEIAIPHSWVKKPEIPIENIRLTEAGYNLEHSMLHTRFPD